MKFRVTWDGRVVAKGATDDEVASFLESLAAELFELDGADHDLSASVARRTVTLALTVDAPNLENAGTFGGSIIRCAIHATGADTPGWSNDAVVVEAQFEHFEINVIRTETEQVGLVDA